LCSTEGCASANEYAELSPILSPLLHFTGPRTATKYIITGKTEAVRSATAQFEKILGLEPGSSAITDTTGKTIRSTMPMDGAGSGADRDVAGGAREAGARLEPGDSDLDGKKMRRKKKRGGKGGRGSGNAPRGSRDGPPPTVTVERRDV